MSSADSEIRSRLEALSGSSADYWAFRGRSKRGHAHALFQYPAMMVPQMQGELVAAVAAAANVRRAFDPFVGSGTTMTECVVRGMGFTGWDINPLAVLLCLVKAGPLFPDALEEKRREVLARVGRDRSSDLETDLPNVGKWFGFEAAIALSRLRRAIRKESARWARRFFWVGVADAVRLCSNSRTSTFKLHVRAEKELLARRVDPLLRFGEAVERNIGLIRAQIGVLRERGLVRRGRCLQRADVRLRDAASTSAGDAGHDLLVSSPPYGDNKSTVPYGQYSYLPLSWIDGEDIVENWDEGWLKTTHEIDTRSLGGFLRCSADDLEYLCAASPAFRKVRRRLNTLPKDRLQRVAAFCRDLDRSLGPILGELRDGAYLIWTVGNRCVGGKQVPLDAILGDLLKARGCEPVAGLSRPILSKRMAHKNSISETMRAESVMVFRK